MSNVELECRGTLALAYLRWEMEQLPPDMMMSAKGWRSRVQALMTMVHSIMCSGGQGDEQRPFWHTPEGKQILHNL